MNITKLKTVKPEGSRSFGIETINWPLSSQSGPFLRVGTAMGNFEKLYIEANDFERWLEARLSGDLHISNALAEKCHPSVCRRPQGVALCRHHTRRKR
jgi:hypothetical protein